MICLNKNSSKTKEFSLILTIVIAFSCFTSFVDCLYEDQVGKFDWSQSYAGPVRTGFLDDRSGQIYVSTAENVIAALSTDNGNIIWRQIFEKGDRGEIRSLLFVNDEDATNENSVRSNSYRNDDSTFLITVSGQGLLLVRGWNAQTGNLLFEWTTQNDKNAHESHWFYRDTVLYQVVPTWNSASASVYQYRVKNGQVLTAEPKRISLRATQSEKCDFVASFLLCSTGQEVIAVDLIAGTSEIIAKTNSRHRILSRHEPFVLVSDRVHNLKTKTISPIQSTAEIVHVTKSSGALISLQASLQQTLLKVSASNLENGNELNSVDLSVPEHLSNPSIVDATCKRNKREDVVCRVFWSSEDGAALLTQGSKLKWIREESLANIVAIEMIDLPLADSEGAIEKQLKTKNGDIVGNFVQRVRTQLNHVQHLLQTLFDVVSTHSIPESNELTRDAFGLHTIIVAVSSTGKVFGIDNISGKHHYIKYLPNFTEFNHDQGIKLIVQRTSKHFPHSAQVSVLGKSKVSGNGLLYSFNPITGIPINGGIRELDYEIRQLSVLQPTNDYLRGILLLDKSNNVHVIPESAAQQAQGTYIYVANKETGVITGYVIERENNKLNALEIWRNNLSGFDNAQKITTIASKNPVEHVHSQGRVLNDRSVLYKYLNPNLVAVVTQGTDSVYKYVLNVHLLDVVSGSVVATINHRRARGPVNIVHSENWLVYTYYNDKVRRTELTAIELFEGNTQANSTLWTSFDAPPLPSIEQQSYIIPSNVLTMKETITEKGITHKHVLIGLSSGSIIEMPWPLLDPRRPILGMTQPREEGTIPYMPELPLSSESIINYNKSISRLDGIYTAPSGLESTCLVFAYGLDLFVTRVAPSKTYDLLKEDFDYFLISSVLVGLIVASLIVKQMSSKKTLKQAWK